MDQKINGGTQYGLDIDFSRFVFTDEQILHLRRKFGQIAEFRKKPITEENFQALFDISFDLVGTLPLAALPIDPLTIHFILRARINEDDEIFREQQQISYNSTNVSAIKACRFNRPQESMFYGTLPSDKQERLWAGVSLECCKDLISDKNDSLLTKLTFGRWVIKKNFSVLNLCFNEKALAAHPGLNDLIQKQISEFKEKLPPNSADLIIEFWKLFSQFSMERSESEQNYFITTALFVAVREYYNDRFNERINGLVFPSSMIHGEALNIVLVPEAVEEFLYLKEAFMYKFFRDPLNMKHWTGGICSNVATVENKCFEITGILSGNEIF